MRYLTSILLIIDLFIMPFYSSAATPNDGQDSLIIEHSSDFELTGEGTAPAWKKAEWAVISMRNNHDTDYATKVKVLYSDTGIYFLYHCGDKVINSTLQEDNLKLWEEDVVEVFLMPDEKYPLYFEYQLSPRNYELTILIPNLGGNFLGWLPWQYEGDRKTRHNTSILRKPADKNGEVEGWIAEFFIPWKLLTPLVTEPPVKGDRWKANMYRLDYDKGPTSFSWQKTERNFHEPSNFGTFIFN